MPIAFSMQALVDDINKCKDKIKIKKSKKDTLEYETSLHDREEERKRRVKEEMGEARNLWNSLGQKRKSKR